MIGRYQTVRAFRSALEDRLGQTAREQGLDLSRVRRRVAFDRFLARLFAESDPPWLLKGGYAFELRLQDRARATRDLDLSIPAPERLGFTVQVTSGDRTRGILDHIRFAAERELSDGFVFLVGSATAQLNSAPDGGARFPVEARLDGRRFATFHLDIAIGDAVVTPPEWLMGQDDLRFAGVPAVRVAALSREQQFAEKVHAYTLPRGERPNTRAKDFVDLILLLRLGMNNEGIAHEAVQATFTRRATHKIPASLPRPAEHWRATYDTLIQMCGLGDLNMEVAYEQLNDYWIGLLASR